ncbi:uncharacterized protein cubi_02669 [Cryptosporidium ubiquitum]|uniref:Transmembrane protein n=1 Tax=Cryptosporidium ubiquitum TaxID=857276 RepID=A0A1J4MGU9_9CRYT|nr:uncharacterized protein cubi_02669 [Cryptosporidium ubiquitum]OII73457.1 transmembrane protein [Cryptosporidium ubiquitum]
MKLLSSLYTLITCFLIIYVVSATELSTTNNDAPINAVGSTGAIAEKTDEIDLDNSQIAVDSNGVSGSDDSLGLKALGIHTTTELDTKPVDSMESETTLYTTETSTQDKIEESVKQLEDSMPLEGAPDAIEIASTTAELSGDEGVETLGDEAFDKKLDDQTSFEQKPTDLTFDDQKSDDQTSDDQTFDDQTSNEQTSDDQTSNDQTSNDQTSNDQTSNDQTSDDQTSNDNIDLSEKLDEKDQEETQESLVIHEYEVPLQLACETKKLICHNVSSSNAITIQGSRKGSALFASFDSSMIHSSGLTSGDVVSATLVLNKIGGTRTLPVRIDVLNLESKSSHISKSTVLATYQAVLPKTQNSPVSVDVTPAIHELLEKAKDHDKFTVLVSAYSRTRFGDILTFPTKDYPNGLSLKLRVTKLPKDSSASRSEPAKEIRSLSDRIFSGYNLYIAMGILATVIIIVVSLMMM